MKATKTPKTKSQLSAENGIKVLKTAIKSKLSLSEASRQNGFGRNYLSDVKARITTNYKKKNVDKDTFATFKELSKAYLSL